MNSPEENSSIIQMYRYRLENAKDFRDVYELVKQTVKQFLGKYRVGTLLFLDDLPLQVGAYHPVVTNNIIMNRALLNIVQTATDSLKTVNAFIYSILLHEYLHALGYLEESDVRFLVYRVSKEAFGEEYVATQLAKAGPWSIIKEIPPIEIPRRVIEIVKNFEKTDRYIV